MPPTDLVQYRMDYYKQKIYIPCVNEQDEILGGIERWEAHEKGILHRGFTVAVLYKGAVICQHRKHPVFGGVIDMTASSHPTYGEGQAQDMVEAIRNTLAREWNMSDSYLTKQPTYAGKTRYSSFDGKYTEHEVCHYYIAETDSMPEVNTDFAYGFSLMTLDELRDTKLPITASLAPWVVSAIKDSIF